jgi:peroxiredoxin
MNKIKSLFIGMFPMFAMGISGYGIYQLFTTGINLIWLGAVLITLPIMLFFSRVMMFKDLARTTPHFPVLTGLAISGLALSMYGFIQSVYSPLESTGSTLSNEIAIVSACIGFVFFLLYNFWYSSLDRGVNSVLQVGGQLPAFKVTDIDRNSVDSNTFKGTPSILIFFRGNWCPLCIAQIKEIASRYRELSVLGAKVILIAPQPEKNTQALADKFDVPFIFLTDVGNRAAQTLGLEMKNGLPAGMEMLGYDNDTVYPTVIITDVDGRILYSDFTNNYRIRPEPDEFIKVLNENTQLA